MGKITTREKTDTRRKAFRFSRAGKFSHALAYFAHTNIPEEIPLAVYICVDALFKQPLQHEAYHPSFRDPVVIELTPELTNNRLTHYTRRSKFELSLVAPIHFH